MYKWKPRDINAPFKTRKGEKITDIDKYAEMLKKNNITFTKEQYEQAKKELDKI
ncbi:hypothetical protein [uncultured Clostridium sp.]|uniref:hypothetical protein n=1 Tax=uncultured Clostridium sp. TaxID=59620 RepID=UPI0025E0AA2D|nr:hypothetical protein [uncultured Clostridium sp.]